MSPPERRPDDSPEVTSEDPAETAGSPEFFIDRSLGRRHLARALADLGLTVHH
jgi:hypothetical protein